MTSQAIGDLQGGQAVLHAAEVDPKFLKRRQVARSPKQKSDCLFDESH
jgi:hypothetical protein